MMDVVEQSFEEMNFGFEKLRRLDFISNELLSNNDRMKLRYLLNEEKLDKRKMCWKILVKN